MAKAKDFREMSVDDLNTQYHEFSKALYLLRNEKSVKQKMDKPHLIREKKKDRARVMTVLREKEVLMRG